MNSKKSFAICLSVMFIATSFSSMAMKEKDSSVEMEMSDLEINNVLDDKILLLQQSEDNSIESQDEKRKKQLGIYNLICPLCLEEVNDSEKMYKFECKDMCCAGCFSSMVTKRVSWCPLCKKAVRQLIYEIEDDLSSDLHSAISRFLRTNSVDYSVDKERFISQMEDLELAVAKIIDSCGAKDLLNVTSREEFQTKNKDFLKHWLEIHGTNLDEFELAINEAPELARLSQINRVLWEFIDYQHALRNGLKWDTEEQDQDQDSLVTCTAGEMAAHSSRLSRRILFAQLLNKYQNAQQQAHAEIENNVNHVAQVNDQNVFNQARIRLDDLNRYVNGHPIITTCALWATSAGLSFWGLYELLNLLFPSSSSFDEMIYENVDASIPIPHER